MKKLILLQLLLVFTGALIAQTPPPCNFSPAPGADLCGDVCVSCNFNGVSGATSGYTGQTPPGFCGTIENEQWFAVIAAASAATFTATPSDCANGNGIQIALYTSCFGSPVACNGGMSGGGTTPVSVTANLTPGQVYYILIDGYAGDQCQFNIQVNPPAAVSPFPADPSGPIQGPDSLCSKVPDSFFIQPVNGAGFYTWSAPPGVLINGQPGPMILPAPSGNRVQIQLNNQAAQICVSASNTCFPPVNTSCKTIPLQPSAPAINLPSVTVCAEDLPYLLPWGEPVTLSGTYQHSFTCDSVLRQQVLVKPPLFINLPPMAVCKGDSIVVCGKAYFGGGSYSVVCQSIDGCDSTVNFSFLELNPVGQILTGSKGLTCTQPMLTLNSAPSPGAKTWLNHLGDTVGTGNSLNVENAGKYTLQTSITANGKTCSAQFSVLIKNLTAPPPISASGGVLTAQNLTVMLRVQSLFSTVSYQWTGPNGFMSNQQNPIVAVPGMYTIKVTDWRTGCSSSATVEVTQE